MRTAFLPFFLLVSLGTCGLSSCALINSPIRVAEEAAKASIRLTEKTIGLGLEILEEPFEDDEKLSRGEKKKRRD